MTSSYTGKFYVFPPLPASAWTSHKSIRAGSMGGYSSIFSKWTIFEKWVILRIYWKNDEKIDLKQKFIVKNLLACT